MPAAAVAVASFIASAVTVPIDLAATALSAAGLEGAASAVWAMSDAVDAGVMALSFDAGVGAGLQSWALVAGLSGILLDKPKLNQAGTPQEFKADISAGIPIVLGEFGVGGNIIYQTTSSGSNTFGAAGNQFLSSVVILSGLGPIQGIESLTVNQTQLVFTGQAVTNGYIPSAYLPSVGNTAYANPYVVGGVTLGGVNNIYNGHMWQNTQLGALSATGEFMPPLITTEYNGNLTEWDSTKKLSGFAASFWVCQYDTATYAGGLPKPQWKIKGIMAYDPRQDSTYPGGSGSQRWADRTTWSYSTNPYIHALNYALGFWLPDPAHSGNFLLYAGIGAPAALVDTPAFVAGANVADANTWQVNGQWTTKDDPYAVLTLLLQAGGGQPVDNAGMISCVVSTPLTAVGTLGIADLATGNISVDTQSSIRARINRIYPKYREPANYYEWTDLTAPITGSTYVTEDNGRIRSKNISYEFVSGFNGVNQCAQLAAYDIANSREGIVATVPCKLYMAQWTTGAALTVTLPDAGLNAAKMVVQRRQVDWKTGVVTLTLRSETDAKHAWALGKTGTAPASPVITGADLAIVGAPMSGQWSAAQATITDSTSGESKNVIRVTGNSTDNAYATQVVVNYTRSGSSTSSTYTAAASATQIDIPVSAGTYDVRVHYITNLGAEDPSAYLDLGNVNISASTSGVAASAPWAGVSSKPSNVGALTGSEPIQNTMITISGGALTGIGSGSGTAVANSGITIASNGVLSGAGGGSVTITGLGFTGALNATFGATWGVNVGSTPSNLAALSGSEVIQNTQISISSGALNGIGSGAGTIVANSQISISSGALNGIGSGAGTVVANSQITISGGALNGIGSGAGTAVANSLISIAANGALSGGGGGSVTIGGLGYSGALNATYGATWGVNLGSTPSNLAALSGTEVIQNTQITISGGALNGIGSGSGTPVANGAITISYGTLVGIGTSGVVVDNSQISISGGALNGIGSGAGTVVANSAITLGTNGVLSGAGGGAVSLSGLGAGSVATLNSVDTANITGNAVTYAVNSNSTSYTSPGAGGWYTMQTTTITTVGGTVVIWGTTEAYTPYGLFGGWRILRDGSVVVCSGNYQISNASNAPLPVILIGVDTPGAGSHTYTMQVDAGSYVVTGLNLNLLCAELRR